MSGGTLLFSTDLRTGYADVAALQADLAAGTHPTFAASSDMSTATFDDVVTYQGHGTVKVPSGGGWSGGLEHVLASPALDIWVRRVQRWSPTFYAAPSDPFGADFNLAMCEHGLYLDNSSYANFITYDVTADDHADGSVVGFQDRFGASQGGGVFTYDNGRKISLAALRNSGWHEVVVHFVRATADSAFVTIQAWIDGVPGGHPSLVTAAQASGLLTFSFDSRTNVEADDYINIALVEAYEGGDPYDLLIRKPLSLARTARNATQCAPEDASLWDGLDFCVPAVEGAGAPLELVSGQPCGQVTTYDPPVFQWATHDGVQGVTTTDGVVFGFDGKPALTYPLTIAGMIHVADLVNDGGDLLYCKHLPANSTYLDVYWEADLGAAWIQIQLVSAGVELYSVYFGLGPVTLGPHTLLVSLAAEGELPRVWLDGVEVTLPTPDVGTVLPAMPADLNTRIMDSWGSGNSLTDGVFLWTRVLTDAEIARWNTQPFGLATRAWRKPAPWAYDPAKSAAPALAAALKLLVVANEGTGNPKDLVSGATMTLPAGVTWAVEAGMPVLHFDGIDGLYAPGPVIGQTEYTVLAVFRVPTVSLNQQTVFTEFQSGENPNNPVELYNDGGPGLYDYGGSRPYLEADAVNGIRESVNKEIGFFSQFRIVVIRRVGSVITMMIDGVLQEQRPGDTDPLGVLSAPTQAIIGQWTHDGISFAEAQDPLVLAGLAVWDTARSDEEIATLSADPFIVARRDYAKPLTTVGWTPATSLVPAVATKAKILFPFTEGSSNPKELVSGETLTLEDGDEWATANGLLGITLVDYTDGSTPGTDVAGRLLDSYGPAFHAPCVLWALVSIPTNPANILGLDLYLFGWNSYGITIQLYPGEVFSGGEVIFGGFYAGDGTNTLVGGSLGIPSLPPGSLVSVVIVCKPGEVLAIYYNEVPVASVHSYNTGTVNSGDATEDHETPFNLGYAQRQNHDDNGVEVPDTDRFVIHGAGIFEGMTDPEIAAFVADPMNVLRQAEAGGGGASGVRRRRRRVLLAQR